MALHAAARAGVLACATLAAASGAASSQEPTPPPSARPVFTHRAGGAEGGEARRNQQLSRFLLGRSRNLATLRLGSGEVMANVGKLPIEGPDFAALASLPPGEVQPLAGAAACKLRTDLELRFGDVVVPTGNVAADYAGLYSFWLRAPETDSGAWRLVFNDEADVWGTQHDPARDRVEVPLTHEIVAEEAKELTVGLPAGAGGGGILELRWGPHRWSAPFTAAAR